LSLQNQTAPHTKKAFNKYNNGAQPQTNTYHSLNLKLDSLTREAFGINVVAKTAAKTAIRRERQSDF
jgi:hypothetical protein